MSGVLTAHRKNVVLVLVGAVVLPPLTTRAMPQWFPESTALTLCIGVSLAMAALSLNLLLGYAGQLSLGHGALLGAGAFAASIVVDRWSGPMFVAWVVAAAVGAVTALAIGLPALRLRGLYLGIVTVMFGLTMQASVLRWQVFTRGSAGALVPRRLWGESQVTSPSVFLSMVLVVLVAVWLVDRNVMRTRVGRAFRLIREDEVAAQSFGIDVTRYKLLAFVVSGAIAGLAGALYGHALGLVNSDVFPLDLSLRIVLLVIIGGIGRRWGVATAAVVFALAPLLPDVFQKYELAVAALVVVYNVVRLPGGLAGLVDELVHGARRSRLAGAVADDDAPIVADVAAVARAGGAGGTAEPVGGDGDVLAAENITVRFGGLLAVDDVSLRVPSRTVVGIIGPNGAGKSTLFNAISGFVPGSTGRIALHGRAIEDLPAHQRARLGLGRTFQLVGLARQLSVRDNLLAAQHLRADYGDVPAMLYTGRVDRVERDLVDVSDRVLDGLGFSHDADRPLGQMSGGQQRLVELAAVLATRPALLMLDEPTAGLSPGAAETLATRLRELRDDAGQSILLIEHNVPLVLDVCDYVYVLSAGRLLAEGTPHDLARNPEILSAYLGEAVA